MLQGAFGSAYRIRETIIQAIPLLIAGLELSIAFKMNYWIIGGEGQIMMGAFGAALIPTFFRVKWKTNETILTLLMNYIALEFVTFRQYGPWRDKLALGFPKIPDFSDNATLPDLFKIISVGL